MKNQFISPHIKVWVLFYSIMFVFYGCRKEPDAPPADSPPLDIPWLLTGVHVYYFNYPPQDQYEEMQHSFQYNAFSKISVHKMQGYYSSGYDSFFYDAHQRIAEIRSGRYSVPGSRRHKQIFQYDAYGQKQRAFKYFLDTTIHQYRMADSTVYTYQDPTIIRITYHLWNPYKPGPYQPDPLPGTIDTSSFTYNQEGNLVKASLKYGRWYGYVDREYTQYDSTPNPYQLLGVQGLELDPLSSSEWEDDFTGDDFTLQMQVPKFSKNNYRTKMYTTPKPPYSQHYTITYGGADSSLAQSIIFYYEDLDYGYEYGQEFTYTPR